MGNPTNIGPLTGLHINENPQMHSTCRVFVASHNKGPYRDDKLKVPGQYDISDDVIDCNWDETFQGSTCSFTLLPRRPYQEMLYPGDWVSVYVSSGADMPSDFGVEGDPERADENIRVFLGIIDAVRESTTVQTGTGVTQVRISVNCSGINKAFDRTTIYLNPSLGPNTAFGQSLPGLATLVWRVPMIGSPTSLPRAIALAYLGYGGQFLLPDSYPTGLGTELTRAKRLKSALENAIAIEKTMGLLRVRGPGDSPTTPGTLQQIRSRLRRDIQPNSILSLVDLFNYVEDFLVDGRTHNAAHHDMQGSVWSLMQENVNPFLNEMFVSLLPEQDVTGKRGHLEEVDEWGMRPRYTPSLVIRERPFSWLDEDYKVHTTKGLRPFKFGNVFFSSREKRASVPRLQYLDVAQAAKNKTRLLGVAEVGKETSRSYRFVDRVKLRSKDITQESLGMSDNDTYNFFMASQILSFLHEPTQKYTLVENGLIPVFLPESIKRYGLRTRELTTKFSSAGTGKISRFNSIDFLIRMLLLQDLWYQHQPWYRAGSITSRPVPKARVGMALDVSGPGREETFYIEGVSGAWQHTGAGTGTLTTSFTVTRGQPSGFSDPKQRFKYAPPDAVQIFRNGQQVERKPARVAPPTPKAEPASAPKKVDPKTTAGSAPATQTVPNPDPAAEKRMVQKFLNIVRVFETGRRDDRAYYLAHFEPQGELAFGIIQFNQRVGTLPELFQNCHSQNPQLFKEIFSTKYYLDLLDKSWVRSANFKKDSDLLNRTIRMGKQAEFQQVQRDMAENYYYKPAKALADRFGLKSERAVCMCFDTAIQFGTTGTSNSLEQFLVLTSIGTGGPPIDTPAKEKRFLTVFASLVDDKARKNAGDPQNRRTKELNSQSPAEGLTDEPYAKVASLTQTVGVDGTTASRYSIPRTVPREPPKEDRQQAGKPPWTEQKELHGKMYDPIRRPVVTDKEENKIKEAIKKINQRKK